MDQDTKKRKVVLYTFLEVVCVLIICIVGNCFDWLSLKFTLEKITTWNYWNGIIQQTIMYSSAMIVGYLSRMEKLELNSEEYFVALEKYRELLKIKKDSFNVFIDEYFNPNTKKKFIKIKAKNKLYKLDKHSKDEWKLDFQRAIKEDAVEFKFSSKKSQKYFKTRMKLEELASDKYIESSYQSVSIKYPRVSAESFTYSLHINVTETSMYKVENEVSKELPLKIFRKILMAVLCAVCIGLIAWDPDINDLAQQAYGWLAIIIKYLLRVFMIFVNLMMGIYSGTEMFNCNFTLPITNRCRILKEYITWDSEHGSVCTYGDKLIEAYENTKKVSENLKAQIEKASEVIH